MDALKSGVKLHESGDRKGALEIYVASWQSDPSAEAAYLIGLIQYELGDYSKAKEWLEKSRELNAENAHLYNLLGELERHEGNYIAAYESYTKAVELNSCFHQAYFGLGQVCVLKDSLKEALGNFHKAVFLSPRKDVYWGAFIHTLIALGKNEESVPIMKHALEHCPASQLLKDLQVKLNAEKHVHSKNDDELKIASSEFRELFQKKDYDEAEALIQRILRKYPEDKTSLYGLAKIHIIKKNHDEALKVVDQIFALGGYIAKVWLLKAQCYAEMEEYKESLKSIEQALILEPENSDAHFLKGLNLKELGNVDDAIKVFLKAHELNPDDLRILLNLGNAYMVGERYAEASSVMKLVLMKDPDHVMAHVGLAAGYYHSDERGDSLHLRRSFELCRRAIELAPEKAHPHQNIGSVLMNMVLIDAALEQMIYAFDRSEGLESAYSSMLFHTNYSSSYSFKKIAEMHKEWSRRFEEPVYVNPQDVDWKMSPDPDRKLRVGFLSPDLKFHPVAYFLAPLLESIDKDKFDLVAFSELKEDRQDKMTHTLKEHFADWYDIHELSDSELSKCGQDACVDILVDLSGHTTDQRLIGLAGRMAPIQVEWLGYPNTTGMRSVDYRITDPITEPVGEADEYSSEKLIRMENGFHVYKPYYKFPDVAPCPWVKEGHITFGSFNNVRKITPDVIALWARILKRVPNSTLLLKDRNLDYSENRSRILSLFVLNGVSSKRINLIGMLKSNAAHLNAYSKIDIALDPFPYNGTTTTCEALYMGVPVITLLGDRHAARVTSSILTHAGRSEWIAENEDEYVDIAAQLASEPYKMIQYRKEQRSLMDASVLCNVDRFTKEMENVFRNVWKDWCTKQIALGERK